MNKRQNENHPITIEGIDGNGNLELSDHGITYVDQGDTVTWKIGQNSGVAAITAITNDPGSPDVFDPDPAPLAGSSNWQGTVSQTASRGSRESYTIQYTRVGGGASSFDPIIQLNP